MPLLLQVGPLARDSDFAHDLTDFSRYNDASRDSGDSFDSRDGSRDGDSFDSRDGDSDAKKTGERE